MKKQLLALVLIVSIFFVTGVSAFNLYGHTKYINGSIMGNVNISVEIYSQQNHMLNTTISNTSNASGFFNITINESLYGNNNWSFKPVLVKYNGNLAQYIGQSLPDLPYQEFSVLASSENTFYLKPALTIDLSAVGTETNAQQLSYGNNSPLLGNYSKGLEIMNYSLQPGWALRYGYINESGCLILLNETKGINATFCDLNITNIKDLEYFSSTDGDYFYFVNESQVEKCSVVSGASSLACNVSYNITDYNYSEVFGIERVDLQSGSYIFISANNQTGTHVIGKFYPNLTYIGDMPMPDLPAGKMSWYQGYLYFAANSSGQYIFYGCVFTDLNNNICDTGPLNFSQGSVINGIDYNVYDNKWYYASSLTKNMTVFSFRTNRYGFQYQVKDTRLGYPIKENFGQTSVTSSTISLPADRNYSIMLYPMGGPAFPVKINVANIANGTNISLGNENRTITLNPSLYLNLSNVNLTTDLVQLSGYAKYNVSLIEQNYTNFTIIAYLIEAGNMVFQGASLPANMGQWDNPPVNDTYNTSTGFYNITLPASVLGANLLLFATASQNVSGNLVYYGGFAEKTLVYGQIPNQTNITLYPLTGNESVISVGMGSETVNATTARKEFRIVSNGSAVRQAHVEVEVDYSQFSGSNVSFSWMADVGGQNTDSGVFRLPLLNNSGIKSLQIFSPQYAPLKKSVTASELQTNPVYINLTQFSPMDPEGNSFSDIEMMMYRNGANCSVPNPPQSCYLINSGMSETEFNPISVVMGGGRIDFEIKKTSNNITVRYINVDLLASGPPDALFDGSANSSSSGNAIEEAWRFGSAGPDIYDYILIGVPYNESAINESAEIRINITKFYGNNFNTVLWQQGINTTAQLTGTDYSDYNSGDYASYINGSGVLCNSTDENLTSSLCYKDTSANMLWFKIPHFSGISPSIIGSAISTPTQPAPSGSTPASSGGGATLSSGFFWITTYVYDSKDLREETPLVKELGKKYRIRVKVNNDTHYVGIVNLTNTTATINVSSESQQAVLAIGGEARFEVTGDNYYDIYVKLNNISNNKANITLKGIHEKIASQPTPLGNKTENKTEIGPVCGNGIIETGEECDGNNFGGKTCKSEGFASGTLNCINCSLDTSNCIPMSTKRNNSSMSIIIWLVVLIVVAGLSYAGYLYYSNKNRAIVKKRIKK